MEKANTRPIPRMYSGYTTNRLTCKMMKCFSAEGSMENPSLITEWKKPHDSKSRSNTEKDSEVYYIKIYVAKKKEKKKDNLKTYNKWLDVYHKGLISLDA